ncbi:hypothetical protein C900_05724 [Fulvivirga imtechensis AK7]|uniref:Uncharacterized protein n=1 Tax=Fulvivirga imtechensis AK7 TaxID=1237149 RepID=L8JZJ8_9BACT|nr:hypothetical protein [Fulvivirga imtechensis]ELR73089.1 hypothetical protein C900_05724 [Fulvivirga imtechensis AK7]
MKKVGRSSRQIELEASSSALLVKTPTILPILEMIIKLSKKPPEIPDR